MKNYLVTAFIVLRKYSRKLRRKMIIPISYQYLKHFWYRDMLGNVHTKQIPI